MPTKKVELIDEDGLVTRIIGLRDFLADKRGEKR